MWYDLLKVKDLYLLNRMIVTKKGDKTRFWLDPWLHSDPLCKVNPILFELCENKHVMVAQAVADQNISFRRWLFPELRDDWNKL